MIRQTVFYSFFFVPMGKMQLLWLRVMMPVIRNSLKAAHFVSQFFVLISFFKNFSLIEAKTAITSEVLMFFFHYPQTIGFRLITR